MELKRFLLSITMLVILFSITLVSANYDDDEDSDSGKLKSNYTVTHEAWFEVEIKDLDGPGEDFTGKFTVALFGEVAPMTVLNFVSLAKGHIIKNKKLHYKGTNIHRIVQDFVVQMGDITVGDGTGGTSIFGPKFNDEPFILSHRSAGWISMANAGPDTNNSQFFILLNKARWLNGKHVVFGKVTKGFEVIRTLGDIPINPQNSHPKKRCKIIDCGASSIKTPYEMKADQLDNVD